MISDDYWKLLPKGIGKASIPMSRPVSGTKTGLHQSPFLGISTEFSQHRQYTPGDDPRRLDWRVLGKTDRYYIKQFVEETNVRANIILDCSLSMNYSGELALKEDGGFLSKLDYGKRLAATLSYLLVSAGDAVSFIGMHSDSLTETDYGSTPHHLHLLLSSLNHANASSSFSTPDGLQKIAEKIPSKGFVILISDCFFDLPSLFRSFHHFAFKGHEVVLFHVMAKEELTFPFHRTARFRDVEQLGTQVDVEPNELRKQYLEKVREYLKEIRKVCSHSNAGYAGFSTDRAILPAVTSYLGKRMFFSRGAG